MCVNPWDFPLVACHAFCSTESTQERNCLNKWLLNKAPWYHKHERLWKTLLPADAQRGTRPRLGQFHINCWQPEEAEWIPVGATPGQQERNSARLPRTLITQCTAARPRASRLWGGPLRHMSDTGITLSGSLKDYWWGKLVSKGFSSKNTPVCVVPCQAIFTPRTWCTGSVTAPNGRRNGLIMLPPPLIFVNSK